MQLNEHFNPQRTFQQPWLTPFLALVIAVAVSVIIVKMWQNAKLNTIEHPTGAAHEIITLSQIQGSVHADLLAKSKQEPEQLTAREYWQVVNEANDRCDRMPENNRERLDGPCALAKVLLTTYGKPR